MRCADDERNADDGARLCVLSKRLPPIGRELYEPGPGESTTGWFSARADCEPKPPAPSFDERPNDFCEVAAIPMASYASYCPGSPICSSTFDNRFEPDLNADDGRFASRRAPALVAMPAVLYEPGPGVAARRYALLAAFSACSDARCDGVRPPVAVFGIAGKLRACARRTKKRVLEASFRASILGPIWRVFGV